jgi:hypothetical protein
VELFPDHGDFEQWRELSQQIPAPLRPTVLADLERNAPTTAQRGFDLADLLVVPDTATGYALTVEEYPTYWDFSTITREDMPERDLSWMGI